MTWVLVALGLFALAAIGFAIYTAVSGDDGLEEYRKNNEIRMNRWKATQRIGGALRVVKSGSDDELRLLKAIDDLRPTYKELRGIAFEATGGGHRSREEIEDLLRGRMVDAAANEAAELGQTGAG
jgi:hypothetical protein